MLWMKDENAVFSVGSFIHYDNTSVPPTARISVPEIGLLDCLHNY